MIPSPVSHANHPVNPINFSSSLQQPIFAPSPSSLSSTFPSPCSAFTELHPRNSRLSSQSQISQLQPRSVSAERRQCASVLPPVPPLFHATSGQIQSVNGSQSERNSPLRYDGFSSSVSSSRSGVNRVVFCHVCGQLHDPSLPHLYHYTQAVDADLCCNLCNQPLVEPLDTRCGHTFCTPCLKNHLTVQALCPMDKQIINYLQCQQASNIVKRLLDKLLVACPNTQLCNFICYRSSLEEHIRDWCPGTSVTCENAARGCTFEGSRSDYQHHRWKCIHHSTTSLQLGTTPRGHGSIAPSSLGLLRKSNPCLPVHPSPQRFANLGSRSSSGHTSPFSPITSIASADHSKIGFKAPLPDIDETYDSPAIVEGAPVSIVVRRLTHSTELGFTFVGGVDSPLACILIQEIYMDGAVAKDGRLRLGDQILEINGHSITTCTHQEVRQQLTTLSPSVQLTIYRERVNWNTRANLSTQPQQEVFHIKLCKRPSKVLGIKLVGKKHVPGLYVLEIVPGCEADLDGRLRKDDQILEINDIDLTDGTQEQAAHIINTAAEFVNFKVRRRDRADTPDIVRITSSLNEHVIVQPALQTHRLNVTARKQMESTHPSSLDRIAMDKCALDEISKTRPRRTRSVQSEAEAFLLTGSLQTETSSLLHTSSASDAEIHNTYTSRLLMEDEDQGTEDPLTDRLSTPQTPDLADHLENDPTHSTEPQQRVITISKTPDEPLGISVAGGRNSLRGDTPVYVTNISLGCTAGRSNLIHRGDVILAVNGTGLVGLTHNEAVDALRRASFGHTRVELYIFDAPETCEGPDNFIPSWIFWLHLPPVCQLTRLIQLHRNPVPMTNAASPSGLEPLGFSILGGIEERNLENVDEKTSYYGRYPTLIMVKSVVPGLLAHRDGRLKCGDLLLSVNNISMLNVSHATAVRTLKRLREDVCLRIISWPGTIV